MFFLGSKIYWLEPLNPDAANSNLLIQCANTADGAWCDDLADYTFNTLIGDFQQSYDMILYNGFFYITANDYDGLGSYVDTVLMVAESLNAPKMTVPVANPKPRYLSVQPVVSKYYFLLRCNMVIDRILCKGNPLFFIENIGLVSFHKQIVHLFNFDEKK